MSRQMIAIRNKEDIWENFIIPENVYLYIMQLEGHINYPESSNLLLRYNDRFQRAIKRNENENK